MLGHEALPRRFWDKVTPDDQGCWIWTGAMSSSGYGSYQHDGRRHSTHRVTWEMFVGPIPDELTIDHLCRVKACCNPDHFEVVTRLENKLRATRDQTSCLRGHDLAGTNLRVNRNGHRSCKQCANERRRAGRVAA